MAYLDRVLTRPVSRTIGRAILPYLGRRRLRHLRDVLGQNYAVALAACNGRRSESPEQLARRAMSNFGAYIADYFLLPFLSRRSIDRWVTAREGMEHLDAALARGQGVILLTCHLGLWELGAVYLHYGGYRPHIVGLVDSAHEGITEFRDWMRTRHHVGVVNRDGVHLAALEIQRLLGEGKIVALLGDRLIGEKGTEVEFFGRRVAFPTGPFRLARSTGAAVLPCFVVREGRGYRAAIEPPIPLASDAKSHGEALQEATQEVARQFEKWIYRYLDQWYVFSPFWEPTEGFGP
jgi:KDO2-lipid IV(A) lauroyltransferase